MSLQREPSLLRFKPIELRALLAVALVWPAAVRAQEQSGASGGEQAQQAQAEADQGDAGAAPSDDSAPTQEAPEDSSADAAAGAQAAPALSPPELLEQVEPEYPAEELAQPREVSVALRLSIDAQGNVVDAEVLESAGPAFDAAALAAARTFRFVPAKRYGTPIGARIAVRIAFRPPEQPATEPAPETESAEASPEAPEPSAQAPSSPAPVEVQVKGQLSRIEQRRKSADAVTVVDLEQARRRWARCSRARPV
jgi:vitamin B12 transporter